MIRQLLAKFKKILFYSNLYSSVAVVKGDAPLTFVQSNKQYKNA